MDLNEDDSQYNKLLDAKEHCVSSYNAKKQRKTRKYREDTIFLLLLFISIACISYQHYGMHERVIGDREVQQQRKFKYMTYDLIPESSRRNGYAVTYSARGFQINGCETLLLGGSIHYPRSTPGMWEDLFHKAKRDGLNFIQLYIFWNFHEQEQGTFQVNGRGNLTYFYDLAAQSGLFLIVRFGPYICGEWENGGLPLWLNWIPDMKVRSSNSIWKMEMEKFIRNAVAISRPYFASNGGPIIAAQIENEYNGDDLDYVEWCGELVQTLKTNIPWIMCNGKSAKNTIPACNNNDCVDFAQEQLHDDPTKPLFWTENEGWYNKWADKVPKDPKQNENRPVDEISYAVARWFAVGGAAHNYYMYHGGNNYGRTASAGVTTKYADGVNLHSDGLSNEPKRTHLRLLHEVLIQQNAILLQNPRQLIHAVPLGKDNSSKQRAFIYKAGDSTNDLIFLENQDSRMEHVNFRSIIYSLARKSMILIQNNKVLFNTSNVYTSFPHKISRQYHNLHTEKKLDWELWCDPSIQSDTIIARKHVVHHLPSEQLSLNSGLSTDYLLYETNFNWTLLDIGAAPMLTFTSCDANAFIVYFNDKYIDEVHLAAPGGNCSKTFNVPLTNALSQNDPQGMMEFKDQALKLLSVNLGVYSLGQNHTKGLTGQVKLGNIDLTNGQYNWRMTPGILGQDLKIFDPKWINSVNWKRITQKINAVSTLTWYKTWFSITNADFTQINSKDKDGEITSAIVLDCKGLTRGRAYINGYDIGRYWLIQHDNGQYAQQYYHIPIDWLIIGKNLLVLMDEIGGSMDQVQILLTRMKIE